jgi:hypothetical protein
MPSVDSCIVLPKRVDSLRPFKGIFLVNDISVVLLGLMDKYFLSQHCYISPREDCNISGTGEGNLPLIRTAISSASPTGQ